MTCVTFYEYFANVFNPYLEEKQIKKPVIVFLDGHVSHMSYQLSLFCKENQIILCCLPPNATHILQPLDVSLFAPLKRNWVKFVKTWRVDHDGLDIKKFDVPAALSTIIKEKDFSKTIKAGFKSCGLFPFDPEGVNYKKCVKQKETLTLDETTDSTEEPLTKKKSLEYFENNIDIKILQQFKDLKKNNLDWNGEIEYAALFLKCTMMLLVNKQVLLHLQRMRLEVYILRHLILIVKVRTLWQYFTNYFTFSYIEMHFLYK